MILPPLIDRQPTLKVQREPHYISHADLSTWWNDVNFWKSSCDILRSKYRHSWSMVTNKTKWAWVASNISRSACTNSSPRWNRWKNLFRLLRCLKGRITAPRLRLAALICQMSKKVDDKCYRLPQMDALGHQAPTEPPFAAEASSALPQPALMTTKGYIPGILQDDSVAHPRSAPYHDPNDSGHQEQRTSAGSNSPLLEHLGGGIAHPIARQQCSGLLPPRIGRYSPGLTLLAAMVDFLCNLVNFLTKSLVNKASVMTYKEEKHVHTFKRAIDARFPSIGIFSGSGRHGSVFVPPLSCRGD